ncbi:MAG TPA: hypothetical protein PKK10_10420 [Woeseiaceae bacterium]|nr:hypothetical protein [Woeseiaceae bacterium]
MIFSNKRTDAFGLVALTALLLAATASADRYSFEQGGHTKLNFLGTSFPGNSLFRDALGSNTFDLQGEFRLNLEWRHEGWAVDANYQLIGVDSEQLGITSGLPGAFDVFGRQLPNDDRRLMNLTDIVNESGDAAILQRLDRLWVGYTSDKLVTRFGRQALTWGNGFFYTPFDLVNPFDPSSIDTEYKAGDDMLYLQYLRGNGDDVQGAIVFRRDPVSGDVGSAQATAALKYHGLAGELGYNALLADNYGDPVLGIGISRSIGGAVVSADLVLTKTDDDTYVELVANTSYSWVLGGKNMSGVLEYFFSAFGLSEDYSTAALAARPDLLVRIVRGQQFTLGRHYLASSVTVEMTPLWSLAPVLLANLEDPSALLQLTSNYSLSNNMTLLGNINIPLGPDGSEFGGPATAVPNEYLSTGLAVFAQFAWYF